ncbi:hypothetical protein [Absidia glauca]|uniref:Uncharacterized protein n=1 Tax=Absidia glauca TaxID=4829 RepID=A0A163JKB6_ABSGL|nr:hypothetical protein [Absidia glauca]
MHHISYVIGKSLRRMLQVVNLLVLSSITNMQDPSPMTSMYDKKKHHYLLTCPSKYSVHPIRPNGSIHAGPFFVSPSLKNQQAAWESNGGIRSWFRLTRLDMIETVS